MKIKLIVLGIIIVFIFIIILLVCYGFKCGSKWGGGFMDGCVLFCFVLVFVSSSSLYVEFFFFVFLVVVLSCFVLMIFGGY